MFTCSVKDYSNWSRLNKNVSYHKVLGEERKDLILTKDGKRFMQNQIKSRKYSPVIYTPVNLYTSITFSENFDIKHLRWSKADLPKEVYQ